MTNDRPNLKQIRIKKPVCERLDERKANGDSYTDVIKALLDENERLTARCEELEEDKRQLYRLAKIIEVNATYDLSKPEENERAIEMLKMAGFELETTQ